MIPSKFLLIGMFWMAVEGLKTIAGEPQLAPLARQRCMPKPWVGPAPVVPGPLLPPGDLVITANLNQQYVINGIVQPTLTMTRGRTYTLDLSAITDEHPFTINGTANSPYAPYFLSPTYGTTVPFTPTAAMPATIHYHCTVHYGTMSGTIQLVNCAGDLNTDASVNTADFGLFVNAFGTTCTGCAADQNNDGWVNTTDFGPFVNAFGSTCP